jgi:tRNA-Thr(GGU) m(6)t(6)A37 methyltransferase TsaA
MVSGAGPEISLKPIGVVVRGLPRGGGKGRPATRLAVEGVIRVYDEYSEGLSGLEGYSHAFIIYWMHEAGAPALKVRPWGDERLPEVGVFASRSPRRPNPIGLTVVEILEVDPPILRVRGLDAWPGTPVLDIKPYDYYDIVRRPRVPAWFEERWRELSERKRYGEIAPWMGPCEC